MKDKIEQIFFMLFSGFIIFIQTFISIFILLWILQLFGIINKFSYSGITYFSLIYPVIIVVIGIFGILFSNDKN